VSIDITSYVNVATRMAELGCEYPRSGIVLLPVNFAQASSVTGLLQASDTATVKKLLTEAGVPVEEILERSRRPMYIKNKSAEWSAPIVFVCAAMLSQNPSIVSVALSVIGNYATDLLKGIGRGGADAKLEIVVETKDGYKKISYSGPTDGIRGLDSIVRRALDE
jgi:hypothetical protein